MKPYIAHFLSSAVGNESKDLTKSLKGTVQDDIRFSTRQTRMVEDTRPDDGFMMWKENIETANIEGTEPDDSYLLYRFKSVSNESTDPIDLQLGGDGSKKTFTLEDTEPDDYFFDKRPISESLEDTEPDDMYFDHI